MEGNAEYIPMKDVCRVPWAIIYKGKRPGAGTKETKGVLREGEGHYWHRTVAGVRRGDDGEVAPYEGLYLVPQSGRTDVSIFPRNALGCYRVDVDGREFYVDFSVHKQGSGKGGGLSLFRPLRNLFVRMFLPQGFPESVPADYLPFQMWDTIQGFSSYVRGMLTSHALMKGVGVGVESASALSAVFIFLMRDIAGMLAGVVFASLQGTGFDCKPKQWRLFADAMNNVGLCLDLLTPALAPKSTKQIDYLFFFCLCFARICFALVGVAGGAARSALTYHFSENGRNAADITSKEGSQETLISLAGMIAGYFLLKYVDGMESQRFVWGVFFFLTVLHMYSNFKAVRSLVLNTLNEDRLEYVWDRFTSGRSPGKVPTPEEYAEYELSFPRYFVDTIKNTWGKIRIEIVVGCPFTCLFDDDDNWDHTVVDPINETFFINLSHNAR